MDDDLIEVSRVALVLARHGFAATRAFCVQSRKVYVMAARNSKYGRRCIYRQAYLKSARSFRFILRHCLPKEQS